MAGPEARRLVALFAFAAACGGGGEKTASAPRSTPTAPTADVATPASELTQGPVVLGREPTPVENPVGIAELVAAAPALSKLDARRQELVTAALNLEPGPCVPCMDDGRSLAQCVVDAPPSCENLDELVARAVRLAEAGAPLTAVRAVVAYADPYTPASTGDGETWPAPDRPVVVELWVDLSRGPWRDAVPRARQAWTTLEAEAPGAPGVRVRTLATWKLREGTEPPGLADAHRAVVAADLQGQGLPFLEALASQPDHSAEQLQAAAAAVDGLDVARWEEARRGDQSRAVVDASQQAAIAIGLNSAPSWRVDGYRLKGHRSTESLVDIGRSEILDHQEQIPGALLPAAGTTP